MSEGAGTRVSKRELNQNTAAVLDMVFPGSPVIITERGEPRWMVVSVDETQDPLEGLVKQGLCTPVAPGAIEWPKNPPEMRRYTTQDIDELVSWTKSDRA